MIQQLAASGGAGVVLMVSASKASTTEDAFTPGAGTGPVAGAPPDDAAPPTEPTLQITLAAPPLSLSVAVNGEIVKIRDLPEPILLTVLSKKKDGFECGFYNETTLEWSSEGMWEHDAGNGALVCASTHLTVLAAIKMTWIGIHLAMTCLPAELLTAKGIASIARRNEWRLVGAMSLCAFTVAGLGLLRLLSTLPPQAPPPWQRSRIILASFHERQICEKGGAAAAAPEYFPDMPCMKRVYRDK